MVSAAVDSVGVTTGVEAVEFAATVVLPETLGVVSETTGKPESVDP